MPGLLCFTAEGRLIGLQHMLPACSPALLSEGHDLLTLRWEKPTQGAGKRSLWIARYMQYLNAVTALLY